MADYVQIGIVSGALILILGVFMMCVGYGLFKRNDDDVTVVSSFLTIGGMIVVGAGASIFGYHAVFSFFL